jgi:hypothetical protein
MKFERLQSGDFLINGKLVKSAAFMLLEPNYTEPTSTVYLKYDNEHSPYRLIKTKEKQYKIFGVWDDGERYFKRINEFVKVSTTLETEVNSEELEVLEDVRAAINQKKTFNRLDKRKLEYPSIEELVVAMWENLIEKKPKTESSISSIQKLRKEIKAKYPSENINALSQDETEIS